MDSDEEPEPEPDLLIRSEDTGKILVFDIQKVHFTGSHATPASNLIKLNTFW